jgi:hypothetical protein
MSVKLRVTREYRGYSSIDTELVEPMKKRLLIGLTVVAAVLAVASFSAYRKFGARKDSSRVDMLSSMPADANVVFFADVDVLRHAPFFTQLFAWAPKPQADADYTQFLHDTGFDYERDLDSVAIAVEKRGADFLSFAVADGRFNRKKITAYALKSGKCSNQKNHEICSVPSSDPSRKISFTFWKNERLALTNGAQLLDLLNGPQKSADTRDWQTRFERLAGSPLFAVIRQDAAFGAAFSAQAPGGLRSLQLATLLDQLQWITLAGIPENDRLRFVAEGECRAEATVRQLSDLLNGVVLIAQAGLNDGKTRQQLPPAAREAYLELLNGADISKLDRGDSKAVRVVLEITPKFLESARTTSPEKPGSTPGNAPAGKAPPSKKGAYVRKSAWKVSVAGGSGLHVAPGIDRRVVHTHFVVHVGARGAAADSRIPDNFAALHACARHC